MSIKGMKDKFGYLLVLMITLFACRNNTSSHTAQKSKKSNSKPEHEFIIEDTLKFENFQILTKYYDSKIDSIEKLKVNRYNAKKIDSSFSIDSIQAIEQCYYDLYRKRNMSIYNYIKTHTKDSVGLKALLYLAVNIEFPVHYSDSLFNEFPLALKNSGLGKLVAEKINSRLVPTNQRYFDTSVLDINFKTNMDQIISLDKIESRYIVLDFWASWCAPCRYENRIINKKK